MNLLERHKQRMNRWAASLTSISTTLNITPKLARRSSRSGASMTASILSGKQITAMLRAWGSEHDVSEDLVKAVYKELQRQARYQLRRERANHTLNTTALINEAYIKLVEQRSAKWRSRGQFYTLAAELMRRILVDHAKKKHRKKRGGLEEAIALDDILPTVAVAMSSDEDVDVLALDEALDRLAEIDPQQVRIVELRYFSGLNVEETAEVLGVSTSTVKREWAVAKSWLRYELTRGGRT